MQNATGHRDLSRDRPSEPLGDAVPTIGLGERHDPTIGTDPPAVKGGGDLLYSRTAEGYRRSWRVWRASIPAEVGFSGRILSQTESLRYFRHP
jgi:hypothetical protein